MLNKRKIAMAVKRLGRVKLKYCALGLLFCYCLDLLGVYTHLFEKDYHSEFSYPLDEDITVFTKEIQNGRQPSLPPINLYNYSYIKNPKEKCDTTVRLLYVVKSAVKNVENRVAIRRSWGFQERFSDVVIRTVFMLGVVDDELSMLKVNEENDKFHDIIQADFKDAYFNNTIKTLMSIKWVKTHCDFAEHIMFSDDDMYISTKNVLRFIRNPKFYPAYLEKPFLRDVGMYNSDLSAPGVVYGNANWGVQKLNTITKLFAGYVFFSAPHRHKFGKWYVPLLEYPYSMWPPYVTAGSYIMSYETLTEVYYGSMYTKHFRFDDVYLGLIAKKMGLELLHNDEFYFYKKAYTKNGYQYVVASHGYDNAEELLKVWNEQKEHGNA